MRNSLRGQSTGKVWLPLCCAALFALSYCVFYALCLRPSSDISIHATWAAEGDFRDLTSFFHHGAHPMWHVLVALLLLPGVPLPAAAALITAASKVMEFLLVRWLFAASLKERFSGASISLAALACVMVSSLCVPGYNPTVYLGVGTPNTWHSCTQLMAMVWMLLCVPCTARCYDSFQRRKAIEGNDAVLPWRMPLLLGFLLLCSLAAKPTFMQVFLPAACLYFLAAWLRQPKSSRFFLQVILCVLPSVLLMVLQYMYYFGIIVPSQGSMVLELSFGKLLHVAVVTLLIQGFPLYALFAANDGGKKDSLFWLTLVMDGVGVLEFLLLGESGRRAADGNFGWGMMGAALMLWVVMLPRFLLSAQKSRRESGRLAARHWMGFGLLGWHLASGIYYIVYLLTTQNAL